MRNGYNYSYYHRENEAEQVLKKWKYDQGSI